MGHSQQILQGRTCKIYNRQSWTPSNDPDKLCPCGRLVRRHSFDGECLQPKENGPNSCNWTFPDQFRDLIHSVQVPVNVFGTLQPSGCKFLRIDNRVKSEDMFRLLVEDCGGRAPSLILSVHGNAQNFTMSERLKNEITQGIGDAATRTHAWILTAGINNVVSKLIGEGISRYRFLRGYQDEVKCIGLTMWGTVNEYTRYELKRSTIEYPEGLLHQQIPDNYQDDGITIKQNHTHYILFDSGRLHEYLGDAQRDMLVKEACKNEHHT
ncbi:unnamed protein product, partial [Rotaria sordida]